MENIKEYLSDVGIRPSYPRIKIYEYLIENKNHPTVNTIYTDLFKELMTLSRTTVYNTLNTFVEKDIVRVVNIEDKELRYDANIEVHGHFKCEKCNKVYDFKVKDLDTEIKELENFKIKKKEYNYIGICNKCL